MPKKQPGMGKNHKLGRSYRDQQKARYPRRFAITTKNRLRRQTKHCIKHPNDLTSIS